MSYIKRKSLRKTQDWICPNCLGRNGCMCALEPKKLKKNQPPQKEDIIPSGIAWCMRHNKQLYVNGGCEDCWKETQQPLKEQVVKEDEGDYTQGRWLKSLKLNAKQEHYIIATVKEIVRSLLEKQKRDIWKEVEEEIDKAKDTMFGTYDYDVVAERIIKLVRSKLK